MHDVHGDGTTRKGTKKSLVCQFDTHGKVCATYAGVPLFQQSSVTITGLIALVLFHVFFTLFVTTVICLHL